MEHSLLYPHASILIRFNIQCMTIKEECHNLLNINNTLAMYRQAGGNMLWNEKCPHVTAALCQVLQ